MCHADVSPTKVGEHRGVPFHLLRIVPCRCLANFSWRDIAAFAVYKRKKKPDIEQAHIRLLFAFVHGSLLTLYHSLPSQQYVQSLHVSIPTASSISSSLWNRRDVNPSFCLIVSTIFAYSGVL